MKSSDYETPARRFRSATIYEGLIRSTTRSFLYGLGQDDDEIARPHLAVIHTGGEMSPCNTSLVGQAQHAKTGIYAAGGGGHPLWVLTISYAGGRTRQFSLRREQVDEVRRWLGNYHKLKEALEDICELNHALLRPDGAAPRRIRKNP